MAFKIKVRDLIEDALENNNTVINMDTAAEQAAFLVSNHSTIKAAVEAGVEMEILDYLSNELVSDNTDRVVMV